jgi:hypothetical protein
MGHEDGWFTGSAGDRNAQAVSLRVEVAPAEVAPGSRRCHQDADVFMDIVTKKVVTCTAA